MKKYLLILVLLLWASHFANAQFTSYSKYDVEESPVYKLEYLAPEEIKVYNSWLEAGLDNDVALMLINAARSQINLINAPATIIDIHFEDDVTELDSLPGAVAAKYVWFELINSTPKTIKEITIEIEFARNDNPMYNIKNGDKYCVLKFTNLKGRSKSDRYIDMTDGVQDCYHILDYNNASYKKLFYNKEANQCRINSVKIRYADGSTSNKCAIFNRYGDDLYHDGPISPLVRFMESRQPAETKEETTKTDNNSVVFSSAANMPKYPGGDASLMKYLNDHMKYPTEAKENNIQGKVVVRFVVKKDGTIGEVEVLRSIHTLLDNEAKRLVLSLPSFSPGRNAVGDPVDVWYTLPVTFKLPVTN